jgi:hypothetical protein
VKSKTSPAILLNQFNDIHSGDLHVDQNGTRVELLWQIMDAAACIQNNPEGIQSATSSAVKTSKIVHTHLRSYF